MTVQTRLIQELHRTQLWLGRVQGKLDWSLLSVEDAPVVFQEAAALQARAQALHSAVEAALGGVVGIGSTSSSGVALPVSTEGKLQRSYAAADCELSKTLRKLSRTMQAIDGRQSQLRNSLLIPALVASAFFVAGFTEGRL